MRVTALAYVVMLRGRLDEAEATQRDAVPMIEANPEPQSLVFIPWMDAQLALVRGRNEEAAGKFAETVDLMREINTETYPEAFPDTVRAFLRAGRTAQAEGFRDLSKKGRSPAARANASIVEGLLHPDPAEAQRLLQEGISALEVLEFPIDTARARVDLARARARAGEDPRPALERAREILVECGARAFLFEVDDATAELET
jgi:ATP/maltotriose-dependent transcriptional regulator MalT